MQKLSRTYLYVGIPIPVQIEGKEDISVHRSIVSQYMERLRKRRKCTNVEDECRRNGVGYNGKDVSRNE